MPDLLLGPLQHTCLYLNRPKTKHNTKSEGAYVRTAIFGNRESPPAGLQLLQVDIISHTVRDHLRSLARAQLSLNRQTVFPGAVLRRAGFLEAMLVAEVGILECKRPLALSCQRPLETRSWCRRFPH